MVQARERRRVRSCQIRSKPLKQAFPSSNASAQIEHRHPAHSQHEGCELLRLSQTAGAQSFECLDKNLLYQILGGRSVSQVTQTIETNARSHPADQLGLGIGITGADLVDQLGIIQLNVHEHTFMCNGRPVRYTPSLLKERSFVIRR